MNEEGSGNGAFFFVVFRWRRDQRIVNSTAQSWVYGFW